MRNFTAIVITSILIWLTPSAAQQEADLAKKLANPIASLISLPIQANYSANIGATEDGSVWRTNVQPVIPIGLTDNINVLSRTILPIVSQKDGLCGAIPVWRHILAKINADSFFPEESMCLSRHIPWASP